MFNELPGHVLFNELQHKFYTISDALCHLQKPTWPSGDFGLFLTAEFDEAVVPAPPYWRVLRYSLLPLLRDNLPRISRLSISLPQAAAQDVYRALRGPAPLLERFELNMRDGTAGQLDTDLFASVPGALKGVYLTNLAFPKERIWAFANVSFLAFTHEGIVPNTERLFFHFSSLRELQMDVQDVRTYFSTFALPMVAGDPSRSTLMEVQARMPARCEFFSFFPDLVALNIPDMQWDVDDKWSGHQPEDLAVEVFAYLPPPLYICLQGSRILYRSGRNNATRRVDMLSREVLSRALLHAPLIWGLLSVEILGVSTSQWIALAEKLANTDSLEVLALRRDEAGAAVMKGPSFPLHIPSRPLQCPAIRMLVLEDELESGRVYVAEIAQFIDRALDRGARGGVPIDLMLKGVAVSGDLGMLGTRIQRIFLCGSDDTSGWLRGLVEHDGTRCNIRVYERPDAREEERDVSLVAQLCMDGIVRPMGNGCAR